MRLWDRLFGECTGCKRLRNDISELEESLERHGRTMDNLELDMTALYDKVKAALARINTRAARASALPPPDGERGSVSADDINQMIRDGVYNGSD